MPFAGVMSRDEELEATRYQGVPDLASMATRCVRDDHHGT